MPNADYWRKRMQAVEEAQYSKTKDYYEYAQEQFRKTEASIDREIELWYAKLAENNEISLSAAKELLRKDELEEFHWTVEEYIKKGESLDYSDQWREALKNASAKVHINRLEAIKLQMQQECEVLYGNLNDNVDAMLRDIYTEGYYRTAFEIQKGTGVGYAFNQLDTRRVRAAINTSWAQDGKNFSDRLWQNKENLVNSLNDTLTQNIIRGENPRKAIEQLSKKLGTSKANAGRLYMTESAAIAAKSQSECYKELDVEEFEFVSTLDTNTCDICGSIDGKHFPMSDYEIGLTVPPLHPNCRCVTAPYFPDDEEEGTRAARNEEGKTYEVPSNMTYEQWKAKYVDKKDIEKTSDSGIIKVERGMSNGLRTSPFHILNDKEIKSVLNDAKKIEIPQNTLRFNTGNQTGFLDREKIINVRGDILPDLQSNNLRDNLSSKAVLAHEYYGHYKAYPSKFKIGDWRDEFNASYRAAIDTPNLSDEERRSLMLDAFDRAKEAGVNVKYNKMARRLIYGYDD
jgi:SPP1 gp7 family putative phage head morphogenesis protein